MNYNFLKSLSFVLVLGAAGILQATATQSLAPQKKSPVLQVAALTFGDVAGGGTAFLLRHDGQVFVATATHVIMNKQFSRNPFANRLFVKAFGEEKFYHVMPRKAACCGDVCLLQLQNEADLEELIATTEVYDLEENIENLPRKDLRVLSCGVDFRSTELKAISLPGKWTPGQLVYSNLAGIPSNKHWLLKVRDCAVFQGMSGGPLLLNNKVIGLNSQLAAVLKFRLSGKSYIEPGFAYCSSVADIKTALKKYCAAQPIKFLSLAEVRALKAKGELPANEPEVSDFTSRPYDESTGLENIYGKTQDDYEAGLAQKRQIEEHLSFLVARI